MTSKDTICKISVQRSVRGVRTNKIAKTSAATIDVVGADNNEIPKSKKYVKKNAGEVNPPVVNKIKDVAKEKTKISKIILERGLSSFFLVKKEARIYSAIRRPDI